MSMEGEGKGGRGVGEGPKSIGRLLNGSMKRHWSGAAFPLKGASLPFAIEWWESLKEKANGK